MTKSHHGSISVSTLCWIIAGFLLDACYVWVYVWVWSWTETQMGHFCILIYWDCFTALVGLYFITVCFGLVRCWPLAMFYWTLCGKFEPNSLLYSWAGMTMHLLTNLEFVVSTTKRDLGGISAMDDEALMRSTGDAVHSPSQLSLLGALPNQALSHSHTSLTSNWKIMCLCGPPCQSRLSPQRFVLQLDTPDVSLSVTHHLNPSNSQNECSHCDFSLWTSALN